MLRTTAKTVHATKLDFLSFGIDMTVQHDETRYQLKSSQLTKTWRTAALLQTTLDLKAMILLFSKEASNTVGHSGITYRHAESHTDLNIGRITKHSCSFQLLVENQKLGEISFMSGKPFTHKQCDQLEFLLASLVYPLRNALHYLLSYQKTITDALTGKSNRFIMSSMLKHEIGLYNRYKTPLTMLIIDIDALKTINDEYGRSSGDKVIQATADTIEECLRETDTVVRYAGDEFIVLLSNTTLSGAYHISEHIRDVIENMQVLHKNKGLNFTVSIGGTSLSLSNTSSSLLSQAYEALRQSKRDGRNRTTLTNHADETIKV
jgi:diguanylate cyclase (GGDEF)-like protein